MRHFILLTLIFLLGSSIASASEAPSNTMVVPEQKALAMNQSANSIQWHDYTTDTFDQAKKMKRMIFLFAESEYCEWCQEMKKTTLKDSSLVKFVNDHFFPVMLDVNKDAEIADRYQIMDLPTIMLFDKNGNSVGTISGFMQANDLLNKIKAFSSADIK